MPHRYIPDDTWAKRAREEGYRARSVYKLKELDERFRLLKPGMRVLDIGAAPGSWLQYASERVGESGHMLGLDLQPIEPVAPNVQTVVCDVADAQSVESTIAACGSEKFDLVLSDIAPSTSGVKDVDQWRSVELSRHVLAIALEHLKPTGVLVMKVFRGADFDEFLRDVKRRFTTVQSFSPKARRERSREVYVVCRGKS